MNITPHTQVKTQKSQVASHTSQVRIVLQGFHTILISRWCATMYVRWRYLSAAVMKFHQLENITWHQSFLFLNILCEKHSGMNF